ncbi:HlyD family secretion protein [Paraglaciecola psychrophila]|uniref:Secretion protein HlyD family protein n=1 Tax=Paraglaciecola psychrophila 170 TaxID=1129794 RepID=K7A881_9ALTE|nr:HlyD family secretion protein [Paraglaciecola psychrophila]AGH43236.1 secretion protein HlyD family protein [Paraglaciecola psychrophila 170]GAC36968.1 multidrug resistance protein A [Paraglaciecola psychrophila 170]
MTNSSLNELSSPPAKVKKTTHIRLILMLGVPLCAALLCCVWYLKSGRFVETDNAYIKANKVQVSAEVAGIVQNVLINENQTVRAGQALFEINPEPFQMAAMRAEAQLAQVRTDIASLQASYYEKQAQIQLANSKYTFQLKELQRHQDLLNKNYISIATFDTVKQNADLAQLQLKADQQDLYRIAVTLGGSVDFPIQQHPNYMAAKTALDQAKLNLKRTVITASLSGTVSVPPKPGQYLNAGQTAMTLVASGNLWIEANYTETQLTHVKPGQTVTIYVDTFPDVVWQGEVQSLSPATSAEFSVLPAQNTTGNWVKVSQRVPVLIHLKPQLNAPELRAGLSVETEIDTQFHRSLFGYVL